MTKIYKLQCPDGNVLELSRGELLDYMFNNGLKERTIYNSRITKMPTEKGYLLLEIAEIESDKKIEVEGKTERKPKYIQNGDIYTIYYGDGLSVEITEEKLSEFKKQYCVKDGLNIEEMGLYFNMLREEVYAIKTAFSIVRNSIPYTDKEIDEMEIDDMAEYSRINKKKAYFRKLDELKLVDMEKELKKLHKKDYLYGKMLETLSKIEIKLPEIEYIDYPKSKNTLILSLADWHLGAICKNYFNEFNRSIAENRINQIISATIEKIEKYNPNRIIIMNLGDIINGMIHESNRANSDMNVAESYKMAIEKLLEIIFTLSKYAPIDFASVRGNHSRFMSEKTANLSEENFEDLVEWTISQLLKDNPRITTHQQINGVFEMQLNGRWICGFHGDKFSGISKLSESRDKHYELAFMGHYHSFKLQTSGNCEVVTVGCMMGSDEYASDKQLYSRPSQLITIIDEEWNKTYIPVYLK